MGAVKAARAAGDQAKITVEGGRTVVTFPLANSKPEQTVNMVVGELNGTPMKVTLDAMYRPARVEVTFGGRAHVANYSEYADLNEVGLQGGHLHASTRGSDSRWSDGARSDDRQDEHVQPVRDHAGAACGPEGGWDR